ASPGDRYHERDEGEREQDLVRGADEHEHGHARPERDEAPAGRRPQCPREEQGPEGETRREHGVARGLVVERRVRRIDEEQAGGEESRDAPERERRGTPADDGEGVEAWEE